MASETRARVGTATTTILDCRVFKVNLTITNSISLSVLRLCWNASWDYYVMRWWRQQGADWDDSGVLVPVYGAIIRSHRFMDDSSILFIVASTLGHKDMPLSLWWCLRLSLWLVPLFQLHFRFVPMFSFRMIRAPTVRRNLDLLKACRAIEDSHRE